MPTVNELNIKMQTFLHRAVVTILTAKPDADGNYVIPKAEGDRAKESIKQATKLYKQIKDVENTQTT